VQSWIEIARRGVLGHGCWSEEARHPTLPDDEVYMHL
jgi:hypothetical protein